MTLNQMLSSIFDKNPELARRIWGKGGWRGLFDPFSAEWNETEFEHKVETLEMLAPYFRLFSMVLAFKECYRHRPDIVQAADFALCKYVEYLLPKKETVQC